MIDVITSFETGLVMVDVGVDDSQALPLTAQI